MADLRRKMVNNPLQLRQGPSHARDTTDELRRAVIRVYDAAGLGLSTQSNDKLS